MQKLAKKLIAVMQECRYVAKNGVNTRDLCRCLGDGECCLRQTRHCQHYRSRGG